MASVMRLNANPKDLRLRVGRYCVFPDHTGRRFLCWRVACVRTLLAGMSGTFGRTNPSDSWRLLCEKCFGDLTMKLSRFNDRR